MGTGPHVSSLEEQGGLSSDRMHTVTVRLVLSEGVSLGLYIVPQWEGYFPTSCSVWSQMG